MSMRLVLTAAAFAASSVFAAAEDAVAPPPAPPSSPGTTAWAKGYPKVVPAPAAVGGATVEVSGESRPGPGWAVKKAWFDFAPQAGGTLSNPAWLTVAGGKWGTADPKAAGKVVPAVFPMASGTWNVRVITLFEGPGADGKPVSVPYTTGYLIIAVK